MSELLTRLKETELWGAPASLVIAVVGLTTATLSLAAIQGWFQAGIVLIGVGIGLTAVLAVTGFERGYLLLGGLLFAFGLSFDGFRHQYQLGLITETQFQLVVAGIGTAALVWLLVQSLREDVNEDSTPEMGA